MNFIMSLLDTAEIAGLVFIACGLGYYLYQKFR